MSHELTEYNVTFRYETGFASHTTTIPASNKEEAKEKALENAPFPESKLQTLEVEICANGSCEVVAPSE